MFLVPRIRFSTVLLVKISPFSLASSVLLVHVCCATLWALEDKDNDINKQGEQKRGVFMR